MNGMRRTVSVLAVLSFVLLGCGIFSTQVSQLAAPSQPTPYPTRPEADMPGTPTPSPVSTSIPPPTFTPEPTVTSTAAPRLHNGLRVVYVDSTRNLWIWDQGQEPLLLANTNDVDRVRLSQDGEWILFTRTMDGYSDDLWLVRPNGSEGKLLLPSWKLAQLAPVDLAHAIVPLQIRWIKGTHKIAISSRAILETATLPSNNDLIILDADTGEINQVFPRSKAGIFFLSPDGTQFALSYPGRIDLMNVDGTNLRSGVLEYPKEYNGFPYFAEPRWSLNGERMVVLVPPENQQPGAIAPLWEVPTLNGKPVKTGGLPMEALYSVSFSPDLGSLIYTRKPEGGPEAFWELHIANGNGGDDRPFASGQLLFEQWAPDSQRFIYDLGAPSHPHMGNMQGQDSGEIAPILTHQIRWVDNQHFLYLVEKAKIWELRLAGKGTESEILVHFPQVRAYPSFDFIP